MECLLALEEEFGEGLLPLYEKVKDEVTNVAEAVAESFAEELQDINQRLQKEASEPVGERADEEEVASEAQAGLPERDRLSEALSIFFDKEGGTEAPADVPPPNDAAPPPRSDGDPSGAAGGEQFICAICAAETTKDYATLTRLEHGEVRCPDCTP